MRIRIITGNVIAGKIRITAISCHKCGNTVWDWVASQPTLPGFDEIPQSVGTAFCTGCKEKLLFDEKGFLLESVNERAGWFSKRHTK